MLNVRRNARYPAIEVLVLLKPRKQIIKLFFLVGNLFTTHHFVVFKF